MTNFEDFFENQSGSGFTGGPFIGSYQQDGHGFRDFWAGSIMPFIKRLGPYIGKTALDTASSLVTDLNSGESFKEAGKKALRKSASKMADDAAVKIKKIIQGGEGVKRRRSKKQQAAIRKLVALSKLRAKGRRKVKSRRKTKKKKKRTVRRKKSEYLF